MHIAFNSASACLLASALQLIPSVSGHSWPEALNLIDNQGTISGSTGYVRNFVPRNATGFKGDQTDSFQKTEVVNGAKTCMDRQTQQTQSSGYPRLSVTPGSRVALRYAENGHVTFEQTGRPAHSGPVYIYGTTDGTDNPLLTDVMAWNEDGTGGNGKGKLLTTQNFDDGRCYELNSYPESASRAAANPLNGQLALPNFNGLPCQNDFVVPTDLEIDEPYTIYWVWNFSLVNPPGAGIEIYSDCLDLDVNASLATGAANKAQGAPAYNNKQLPISAAVSTYFDTLGKLATAAPSSPPAASESSPPLISEPLTGGGVYASSAAGGASGAAGGAAATVTKLVTVTPAPAMQTVYVTVEPNQSGTRPSGQHHHHHHKSDSSSGQGSSNINPPGQPGTTTTSPVAAGPAASTTPTTTPAPSVQSAGGQPIPLITIGSSGPVIVGIPPASTPAAAAPPAGASSAEMSPEVTPAASPATSPSAAVSAVSPVSAMTPAAGTLASSIATPAQPTADTPATEASPSVPAVAASPSTLAVVASPSTLAGVATPSTPSAVSPEPSSSGEVNKQPEASEQPSSTKTTASMSKSTDAPCKNKRAIKKSKLFANLGQDAPLLPPRDERTRFKRFVS